MTNRMKATTYIIGAVLVFALVFAMAFTLVPNGTPTAYAAANVIEWTQADMATFEDYMDEGNSREMKGITFTVHSGYYSSNFSDEYWDDDRCEWVRVFDYCSLSGYSDEKSFSFSIGNGRQFSKIELMGDWVNGYPSGDGWNGYTWTGESSEVILNGYADYVNWIRFTLVPTVSTVTLNPNGGTVNSGDITSYSEGIGATLPTNVTKEGDTFRGWYTNPLFFGDPVVAISDEETGAKTYWAKWDNMYDYSEMIETDKRKNAYSGERLSVSVRNAGDEDGAGIIGDNQKMTVSTTNYGKIDSVAIVLTYNQGRASMVTSNRGTRDAIFSYDGATYVVFKDIDSLSVSFGTNDSWVYVRRIVVNYNDPVLSDVTLHTNGGSINSGDVEQYTEGVAVNLPTDVTKEGLDFAGWYDNAGFSGVAVTAIPSTAKGPIAYWAKFIEHNYSDEWSSNGDTHWHVCLNAGCTAKGDEAAHVGEWVTTLEPTCTTAGSKHKVCTVCGREFAVEAIAATGHNFATVWTSDETNHWHVCLNANCDEIDGLALHTYEWVTTLEPTCTTAGSKHNVCTVCGKELAVEEIEATGHNYATEWTSDGNTHWHVCLNDGCTVKSDEAAHTYAETTDTEAYYTCSVCGNEDAVRKVTYDAVKDVETQIAAIGEVRATDAIKDKINAAKAAYEGLTADQKTLVNIYDTLTTAESTYTVLKNVEDLIVAIGTVEYTAESKDKIEEAAKAFEALSPEQRQLIAGATALSTAEDIYEVFDVIAAIGDVTYTEASKEKIDAARAAFNNLSTEAQTLVTSVNTLTQAEDTYAVKEVIAFIENIGDVEYSAEVKAKIDAAKDKYDNLSNEQKAQVTNTATLTVAEDTYEVQEVIAIINDIGTVEYSAEVKAKIDAANAKYKNLSDEQKQSVTNLGTLTTAESTYEVKEVIAVINAIGDVEYSAEVKAKIDAANDKYNNLSDEQKQSVTNLGTLTTAEDVYDVCEIIAAIGNVEYTAEVKAKIDAARDAFNALPAEVQALVPSASTLTGAEDTYEVKEVIAIINDIGEVGYTAESKELIEKAREAFNNLTEEQKAQVGVVETLTEAESDYADFATEEINDLIDIDEVSLEDKEDVLAAKAAYEALSPEEKSNVPAETIDKINAAVKEIVDIETSNEATATIFELPVVGELSLENKEAVEAAREAYNDLSAEGKAKVSQEAIAKLAAAEKEIVDIEESNETTATITELPAVNNVSIDNKQAIALARAAYDALSVEGKAKVSSETLTKLTAAESVIADIESIVVNKDKDSDTTTYAKEITAKEAEDGISTKQLFKEAAKDASETKEVEIKAGDTSVTFDTAAVNAIGDKDTSFSVKVSEQAPEGAEMQIDLELNGATFAEGTAKVTTKFEKTVPAGKKLVVYHLLNGVKTAVQSWLNNGKLTFATNHFSTYIVVFEDDEAVEVKDAGLSGGAIAGIVIGCFFGLLIIACAVLFLLNKNGN